MRTYLTRLMMAGGGAVLSGVSLTGVAIAGEGDELFVDPAVLEKVGNLEPCDDITGSEDMLFPVDPSWEPEDLLVPVEPDDETETPWGEFELVPCYQIPTDSDDDPDDDGGEGGDGDDGEGDDGDNGEGDDNGSGEGDDNGSGDGGNSGGNGSQGDGSSGEPKAEPSGGSGDGVGDSGGPDEASGDATPAQQEAFAPTSAAGDDAALMLAVLAGVLGTVGLLILIYGLRKRPRRGQQPAR